MIARSTQSVGLVSGTRSDINLHAEQQTMGSVGCRVPLRTLQSEPASVGYVSGTSSDSHAVDQQAIIASVGCRVHPIAFHNSKEGR